MQGQDFSIAMSAKYVSKIFWHFNVDLLWSYKTLHCNISFWLFSSNDLDIVPLCTINNTFIAFTNYFWLFVLFILHTPNLKTNFDYWWHKIYFMQCHDLDIVSTSHYKHWMWICEFFLLIFCLGIKLQTLHVNMWIIP